MDLPVLPPVEPMLAKAVHDLPTTPGLAYEPKWDGFRCLVFRDGDDVELHSRGKKELTRYFPELVDPLRAELPDRCVVDGELVIVSGDGLDFDLLQARIHPAESRIAKLSGEIPASFVAFDLLALGDRSLLTAPFAERRALLAEALTAARPPVHLTPQTLDAAEAADWFDRFEGAGFDGVMAKSLEGRYEPKRRAQIKVKHERTADCVVAGFRWHKDGKGVGSLMLGLYDDEGTLHSVGVASSFSADKRRELLEQVAPLAEGVGDDHPWAGWGEVRRDVLKGKAPHPEAGDQRLPGAPSRWNSSKDMGFVLLRPDRVVEVAYDHLQGDRFRHTTRLRRWRDDREPRSCTYGQLDTAPPAELAQVFAAGR